MGMHKRYAQLRRNLAAMTPTPRHRTFIVAADSGVFDKLSDDRMRALVVKRELKRSRLDWHLFTVRSSPDGNVVIYCDHFPPDCSDLLGRI